ncbi:unnamed protein product [Protopolystoma xenopodis]|uniref:Uncharacterized protein n=1 Tax=Protopolystoma xenopodis TaxID=117903 RepID=A0A448XJQ8_9PLAT|nr:unnamed protein product [Protopolystoma xenopodis]
MNVPVKPIDSWSSRRLPRKQRQHECSSKANRQLVKRTRDCLNDVRHMTDESLAPFHRNRRRLPRKCMNLPVKPIDSWSRGIRRRLLVESNFESLHPHESSSKANRQLVKRNPPSSSGGTALL